MYFLYHIPGKKIGLTNDVENRVVRQQGYNWDEFEILAMDEDISRISNLELELQEKFGYKVDRKLYKDLFNNNNKQLNNMRINVTEATTTFPCPVDKLKGQLMDELGMEWQTDHGIFTITPQTINWIMGNVNTSMYNVIHTLCPISVSYKNYDITSIPLDVLKAIDFCVDKKFFKEIEIHYNDENPDPFVIGVNKKYYNNAKDENGDWKLYDTKEDCMADEINNNTAYEKSSETKRYLIAKWGDEDKPFDVLMKEASNKLKDSIGSKLRSQKSNIENKLSALDDNINLYLLGKLPKYELD